MIRTEITGIGDPFILKDGDTYYMYATSAPDGFKYFTSKNLTDWTKGGYCYKDSPWGENNFWAPEVYARNGKYYMIFTARWKEKHSLRIGVAVADSPEGEFKDLLGRSAVRFRIRGDRRHLVSGRRRQRVSLLCARLQRKHHRRGTYQRDILFGDFARLSFSRRGTEKNHFSRRSLGNFFEQRMALERGTRPLEEKREILSQLFRQLFRFPGIFGGVRGEYVALGKV